MPKQGWDLGLDFETARKKLLKSLEKTRGKEQVYIAGLLVQLVNGLRVSEAWRALQHFLRTRERDFYLEPGKRGKPRPVRIPKIIKPREEWKWVLEVDPSRARKRLHYYARKILGSNTHSLRYALVGYLAKQGVSALSLIHI